MFAAAACFVRRSHITARDLGGIIALLLLALPRCLVVFFSNFLFFGAQLPHLLLYGPPGTGTLHSVPNVLRVSVCDVALAGKTTTINAIARQLYGPEHYRERMLELNASDERGISVVRDKVKSFAQLSAASKPLGSAYPCPPYKLVVLDEADSMTSDAQAALRRIMENYSKATRFCLICNYVSRIIEPLASRCAKFRFQPLAAAVLEARLAHVAAAEGFACAPDTLAALRHVSGGDMRKAITFLQSARTLHGDALDAAAVHELAGVVPSRRVAALLRLACNDSSALPDACGAGEAVPAAAQGGALAALRLACTSLVADGYAAKRVLAQLADAVLLAADELDELTQARMLELLASADHALMSGADEYLQLLHVLAAAQALHRDAQQRAPPMQASADMQTD